MLRYLAGCDVLHLNFLAAFPLRVLTCRIVEIKQQIKEGIRNDRNKN